MGWGKSAVFISGASRGIGKEIFLAMIRNVAENSDFILLARNDGSLSELAILGAERKMNVTKFVCDLGDLKDDFFKDIENVLSHFSGEYENLFVFHNAGTVGDTSKRCSQILDHDSWSSYFNVNLFSMIQLNNIILQIIGEEKIKNRYIINITSLLAIKAFPSLGQYGTGKAAREGFFRALALEEPSLRVLNYSPGPVDTDMYLEIHHKSYDEGIRTAFNPAATTDSGRIALTTSQTIDKLMKILKKNKFISGGRIDYYDEDSC